MDDQRDALFIAVSQLGQSLIYLGLGIWVLLALILWRVW